MEIVFALGLIAAGFVWWQHQVKASKERAERHNAARLARATVVTEPIEDHEGWEPNLAAIDAALFTGTADESPHG